jgi:6-phosphogluconolactonase
MAFAETPACRWHALAGQAALDRELASRVLMAADDALRSRGRFHVVLAGGNTPRGAYRILRAANTDWSAWNVYFGDERCLPAADPARNSRMAQDAWLGHVGIPAAQLHAIPGELGAVRAAHAYAAVLGPVGDFDLVLLGLGEDGHTASLFPGHEWGAAPGAPDTLAILDAPKAPPERVSLSAGRLSRARQVIFVVRGEAKHRAVAGWRAGKNLPARAITPTGGVDVMVEAALLSPLRD